MNSGEVSVSYDLVTVLKVLVFHKLRSKDTSLLFQRSDPLQNLDYVSRIGIFYISIWLVGARITETSSVTGDLRPASGLFLYRNLTD